MRKSYFKILRYPIFIFFSLTMLACSFTDSVIYPQYTPSKEIRRIKFGVPIYLSDVKDKTNQSRQGIKKSELGWQSANIYTDPKPHILIRQAIETEFNRAGLQVLAANTCAGDIVQIHVTLEQYFVEPEVNLFMARICAVVQANITLVFPQGKIIQRRFKGISSIYTPIFWYTFLPMEGEAMYNSALEGATKDFIQQAVFNIYLMLEKHPYFFLQK